MSDPQFGTLGNGEGPAGRLRKFFIASGTEKLDCGEAWFEIAKLRTRQ